MSDQPQVVSQPETTPTLPTPTPEPTTPASSLASTPAPVEPLSFEALKFPEGFEVERPIADKFLGILNDDKMAPGDRANALVALQAEYATAMSEKANAQWDDFNKAQVEEVRADPEIGGAKLEPTLAKVSKLLNTYGSPEVRLVFDNSGAGNNVHIVKLLAKLADKLGEGEPAGGTPPITDATLASRMYPTMSKGN